MGTFFKRASLLSIVLGGLFIVPGHAVAVQAVPSAKPAVNITVNKSDQTTVKYGSTVKVAWTATNVTNCTVDPGNKTGSRGNFELKNVQKSVQLAVRCTGLNGGTEDKAIVEASPPTVTNLRQNVQQLKSLQKKPVLRTDAITSQLQSAEKAIKSGKLDAAKTSVIASVDIVNGLVAQKLISSESASAYRALAELVVAAWTAPKAQVSISSNGCDVSAVAPVGYTLVYGAHDGSWQRGFEGTEIIGASGKVTMLTGAVKGMVTYGNLLDAAGNLVTGRSAVVSASTCPLPVVPETPPTSPTPEPSLPPSTGTDTGPVPTPPADTTPPNTPVADPVGTSTNCGGGYPAKWCEIGQDTVIDSWGMYNRESVSYTAFKVHQDFLAGKNTRDMPYWGGVGNANQWDENAIRAGIPVDTTPTPGSIAISNAGAYGHAMYVEQVGTVNGQQAIYVSQYGAGLDGRYSEGWRYTAGLVFIHF